VYLAHITVMLTQTVPTLKDHSTARVIRDTLEMECFAKVSLDTFECMGSGKYVFHMRDSDKLAHRISKSHGAAV